MRISRRDVLQGALAASVAAAVPIRLTAAAAPEKARVFVVPEGRRAAAVRACLEAVDLTACEGRPVAVKANYNSDDAFPASTHPETLAALLGALKERKAAELTLAERSGMGDTRRVLERTGAADVLQRAGARTVVLDEVGADAWAAFTADHWPNGFHAARVFAEAPCVVQTMCCKTHRFGGHVTLSLKNTVGLVAKRVPGQGHDFMRDLHGSEYQRTMIAEANLAWRPAANVMDCLEAFIDGGPERGTRVAPGVFLASTDRCALDAAAIALLRLHGMRGPAGSGPIGRTAQLARAIELGIGAPPSRVEVVAVDAGARDVARRLADQLGAG
jgi:uncharacterized protein (DUF362 family)